MALVLLYFFLVFEELCSCNAQTTYRNASPSAETVTNATAETTVTNVNTTAVTNTNAPAETTFRNPNTTAETTVANVNVTVGPGCSDPPVLCCTGLNNECHRDRCFCDQACVTIGDCCSDYESTCKNYFQSMTLHLKVSLLTRGNNNNDGISEALFGYLSQILLGPTCNNCSLTIKHISFN